MMAARLGTEELTVKHMRQPCKRMPVAGMTGGKSPDNAITVKTCKNW